MASKAKQLRLQRVATAREIVELRDKARVLAAMGLTTSATNLRNKADNLEKNNGKHV